MLFMIVFCLKTSSFNFFLPFYFNLKCWLANVEKGGELFITLVLTVLKVRILFVGSTALGAFIGFWLVDSSCWVSKHFYPYLQSTKGEILWIIIRDIHQFIWHCLIPLYPWVVYIIVITFRWAGGLDRKDRFKEVSRVSKCQQGWKQPASCSCSYLNKVTFLLITSGCVPSF